MGENKHIKELDAFAKKYLKEIPLEEPSNTFTENLLQRIAIESKTNLIPTAPLISKKVWAFLVACFLVALIVPFKPSNKTLQSLFSFDFSFLPNFEISNWIPDIAISSTTMYVFLIFGALVAVQFLYLKRYFDSRLS